MKASTKRALSGVGAIVLVLALAIGGTFAYRNREHKANTVQGLASYQARLVEEYQKNPEWIKDRPIQKDVSVRNMGGVAPQFPGDNWGDIYVALQLLEYMDVTPVNYTYYPGGNAEPTRFMVDTQGDFVRFPVTGASATIPNALLNDIRGTGTGAANWDSLWANVIGDTAKCADYRKTLTSGDFVRVSGLYDVDADGNDVYYWYLKTKAGDPNGQYGAYVVTNVAPDTTERKVITGKEHDPRLADTVNGQGTATHQEYLDNYAPHNWTACDNASDSYISVDVFGAQKANSGAPGNWMWLSDWDGTTGKFWLIDDTPTREGWAYWAEPLKPTESTSRLIQSLTPKVIPEDLMFYDLYVHMEAYSLSEQPDWFPLYEAPAAPSAPGNIGPASLPNASVNTPYSQKLNAAGATPIAWTLKGGSNLPDNLTLAADGTISGTPTTPGTYTFTVIATNEGGSTEKEITLEVSPIAGPGVIQPDGPALSPGTVGTAYNQTLSSVGATKFTIVDGALPAGLAINETTGAITGTPTTAAIGTATFTVQAENAAGGKTTKEYTIAVSEADTELPTKHGDDPNYGYESQYSVDQETGAITDFTKFIAINYNGTVDDEILGQHDGSIPLKDILVSGPYNNVTLEILDTDKFAPGDITIKQDPRNNNEWSIFYSYYPKTAAEMESVGDWTSGLTIGGYDPARGYNPTIKTKVKLTQGDLSAEVFIQMRFNDSTFPW